jgi:heme/copper-type cytochrome/quinol oxidase subunit 3
VTPEPSYYRNLGGKLARRTREPLNHPSFAIYLLVGVIGFGGLGFWIELYRYLNAPAGQVHLDAARVAIMTLIPALVGSSALQAILAENEQRDLRAFAVLILVLSLVSAFVIGPVSALSNELALLLGTLAWTGALWFWVVTNAEQPEFQDRISPSAPIGGDNPTAKLSGDLDQYTH